MASYRFLTAWLLDARREDVWEVLEASERWPEWWPGVRARRVRQADVDGVGAVVRCAWRSALPYTVRFDAEAVRVEAPSVIEIHATGELAGRGTWRLYDGDATCVTYDWDVETTRDWMNALAPLGRPVFAWNHHVIMRRGGRGLARRLGCRLLAST